MSNLDSLVYKSECSGNSKLYEFLATNYDINNLASKIVAQKNASMSIWNLKKIVNNSDIAAVKSA